MTNLELKEKLNQAAIEHLEDLIIELRDEVKTKLRGEGSTDEGGFPGNNGDYSAQASNNYLSEQAVIRRNEAEHFEQIVNKLKTYNFTKELDSVQLMSLIETNRGRFFISQAVKPLMVDGTRCFFLATDAPIYSELQGKKAGDTLTFREIDYTIKSVC